MLSLQLPSTHLQNHLPVHSDFVTWHTCNSEWWILIAAYSSIPYLMGGCCECSKCLNSWGWGSADSISTSGCSLHGVCYLDEWTKSLFIENNISANAQYTLDVFHLAISSPWLSTLPNKSKLQNFLIQFLSLCIRYMGISCATKYFQMSNIWFLLLDKESYPLIVDVLVQFLMHTAASTASAQ